MCLIFAFPCSRLERWTLNFRPSPFLIHTSHELMEVMVALYAENNIFCSCIWAKDTGNPHFSVGHYLMKCEFLKKPACESYQLCDFIFYRVWNRPSVIQKNESKNKVLLFRYLIMRPHVFHIGPFAHLFNFHVPCLISTLHWILYLASPMPLSWMWHSFHHFSSESEYLLCSGFIFHSD